jgi:pyruvate dehydrogenase E1 component alpha subunit
MLRIRNFEERVRELRLAGDMVGSVHLCIGQEAIPIGVLDCLDRSVDVVGSTYRGHGWALASGLPLREAFAELLGRATGPNGGRGGSAYLTAPAYGFLGENSIVGAGAPIACGAAIAGRFDGSNRVAVAAFGDGAMNQGGLLESLNFAAALRLPVIFVCENNLWSELTPIADMVVDPVLANRAAAFGIPSVRIDGNDPHAVRNAARDAIARARSGAGPAFIEAMTERLVGHYIGDPETYRAAADRERLAAQDPLPRERRRLEAAGVPAADLDSIEVDVSEEITTASAEALNDPLADPRTAKDHVYA